MKWLIRDHPLSDWEELEGDDIEYALSQWADEMDGPNDYFISRSEMHGGIDIEVKEEGSEEISLYNIYPDFSVYFHVSKKQ